MDGGLWKHFEPHYYLKLPRPVAAEYYAGFVDGIPVAHVCACPRFEIPGYRLTRLVVMPEWQGAGVGTRFLNYIAEMHKNGGGRNGRRLPSYFHTSHPQLCGYLRYSKLWSQCSAVMHGGNKKKSMASINKSARASGAVEVSGGYGGHFRAVQGFKYIGEKIK